MGPDLIPDRKARGACRTPAPPADEHPVHPAWNTAGRRGRPRPRRCPATPPRHPTVRPHHRLPVDIAGDPEAGRVRPAPQAGAVGRLPGEHLLLDGPELAGRPPGPEVLEGDHVEPLLGGDAEGEEDDLQVLDV